MNQPLTNTTMLESQIQAKILQYLRDEGVYAVKAVTTNHAGTPDILACVKGTFVGIEVKRPGEKTTKLQDYAANNIRKSGGECWTVTSADEVQRLLQNFPRINHNEDWR